MELSRVLRATRDEPLFSVTKNTSLSNRPCYPRVTNTPVDHPFDNIVKDIEHEAFGQAHLDLLRT